VGRRLGQKHRVLLVDLNPKRLEEVQTSLKAEGAWIRTHVCDITQPASVASLAKRIEEIGRLRTLAHVAGLSPSMADWRTIMRVNLVGPTLILNAIQPLLAPQAVAILIASWAAHLG
jgi:NAD(P)-dependent dehydrogenase (short-subunit alcohol dehydrogenase family)